MKRLGGSSRGRVGRLAGAWLALGGCATGSAPLPIDSLVGCWYFEQQEVGTSLRLPWGVELTRDSLAGWPALQAVEGVRRAATLTASGPRDVPFGYWRLSAGGDSLDLGHPGGGGLALDVAVPAEDSSPPVLSGAVRAVGDVLEPGRAGVADRATAVRLGRARCP